MYTAGLISCTLRSCGHVNASIGVSNVSLIQAFHCYHRTSVLLHCINLFQFKHAQLNGVINSNTPKTVSWTVREYEWDNTSVYSNYYTAKGHAHMKRSMYVS